ncbi:hypothetical protein Angca_001108, partial [Angiostrongylus cantonensis]
WEWDTFWEAFNHSVHSQTMGYFLKMNYLLNFVERKAKAFVNQHRITRESYQMVITHLKHKYGNKQGLGDELLNRVQTTKANSDRFEDQQTLCEHLFSVTRQIKFLRDLREIFKDTHWIKGVESRIKHIKTEDLLKHINEYTSKDLDIQQQLGRSISITSDLRGSINRSVQQP